MAEQGIAIVGEDKESHANPQAAQDVIVKRARDKGWAPEGEWRGPAEDWVDAKEFLGRQKLYDRIKEQKDAIHGLKQSFEKDMKVIQKAFLEMSEVQYKKALADLKAERALAIGDNDVKKVEALDEEIDETKEKLKQAQKGPEKGQAVESPAFIEWKTENQWFDSNSEMKADAVSIGVGYAAANPNKTEQEIYAYVTKKVKKMYPEEFGEQGKEEPKGERKVSNSVEGGGASSGGKPQTTKKSRLTVGDLNDEQRQVMKTLIKRDTFKELAKKAGVSQEEYYLQQYEDNMKK